MAPEPTDPTLGVSPFQGPWAPVTGGGSAVGPFLLSPTSQDGTSLVLSYEEFVSPSPTVNSTAPAGPRPLFPPLHKVLYLLMVLVSLCGAVGNGAVVWLLGFRLKRSPFSVYILNLACADSIFLLSTGVWCTLVLIRRDTPEVNAVVLGVWATTHMAGLGLLMAVSTERCVSVLWPLWHRCRRPAHLSCAVCALIWGLGLCGAVYHLIRYISEPPGYKTNLIYFMVIVSTSLMICVSGLTLLMWVQCSSRGTRTSRLHVTVLLTVLAYLLLALPFCVFFIVHSISSPLSFNTLLQDVFKILLFLNSVVNPVIYFFVGRYRQRQGRTTLREVLQRALQDKEEGGTTVEQGGTTVPTDIPMST